MIPTRLDLPPDLNSRLSAVLSPLHPLSVFEIRKSKFEM